MIAIGKEAARDSLDSGREATALGTTAFPERQRGIFSFMTWPFYLVQAFAAEQLLDAKLKPALADDDTVNAAKLSRTQSAFDDADLAGAGLRRSKDAEDLAEAPAASRNALPDQTADVGGKAPQLLRSDSGAEPEFLDVVIVSGGGGNTAQAPEDIFAKTSPKSSGDWLGRSGECDSYSNSDAVSTVGGIVGGGGNFLADGSGTIESAVNAFVPVLAATSGSVSNLATGLLEPLVPIANVAAPVLEATTDAVTDLAGGVRGALEPVIETVTPALVIATDAVSTLVGDALDTAGPVSALAIGLIEPLAPIAGVGAPVLGSTTDAVTDLAGGVRSALEPVIEAVTPALVITTDAASTLVDGALDTAEPIVEVVEPTLATTIDSVIALSASALGGATLEAAEPVLMTATKLAGDLPSDLLGSFEPTVEMVMPVAADLAAAGAELTDGVVQSVEATAETVASAPTAVVTSGEPPGETMESVTPTLTEVGADILGGDIDATDRNAESLDEMREIASDAGADLVGAVEPMSSSVLAGPAVHDILDFDDTPAELTVASADPAADALRDGDSELSAGTDEAVVASDGVITIENGPISSADDLFAEGRYTDYGITLATDAVGVTGSVGELADAVESVGEHPASTPGQLADDAEEAEQPAQASADIVDSVATTATTELTSTLDDFGLR